MIFNRLYRGMVALCRKKQSEDELDEELKAYLESAVAENVRRGMDPEDAKRAARVGMGGLEPVKDRVRDAGWESLVESCWHDVRYACRMLRKAPGFTAVAVISLALGIGANAAVFTFLNSLLLRMMPVPNPRDLMELRPLPRGSVISFPMYQDLRAVQQVFADNTATQGVRAFRLTIPGTSGQPIELDNVPVTGATGNYFDVLGVQPAIGRFFTLEDDRDPNSSESRGSVIVLSDGFWERQFGRDPQVLGRTIVVDRSPCRVIGVAPRGFAGERVGSAPDAWVPLVPFSPRGNLEGRRGQFTSEIARLKPGVSREFAETATTAAFQQLLKAEGIVESEGVVRDLTRYRIALTPAGAGIDSGLRLRYVMPLQIAMAITMLVLLIACANVANLLIARSARRQGEIGVRLAIGCSRLRLVRQLVTESLVLSVLGTSAGIAVAYGGTRALLRMLDVGQMPIRLDTTPDGRMFLFLVSMTAFTGLVFGLLPALRASRTDPSLSLQGLSRVAGVPRQRLSRMLLLIQLAVSLLLLVGAGLLVESLRNLHRIDSGFRPEHVVTFELQHNPRSRAPEALASVASEIQRRAASLPGVDSASVSWILLFSTVDQRSALQIPGYTPPPEDRARFAFIGENVVMVRYNAVSPTYFNTVGMSLLAGRGLEERDGPRSPSVAVINESMARRYFPMGDAVGRSFLQTGGAGGSAPKPIQIVGVARDAKFNNLREEVMPMFYMPIAQVPRELRGLEVRTRAPDASLITAVRGAIGDVTKDIMIRRVASLTDQVDRTLTAERLMMRLATFFGAVALLLAAVGLYGVLAYQVAQRTGEIGIRLALGATRGGIVRLVVRDSASVVVAGIVAGLGLAIGVTRVLASFLYGLTPTDPGTIGLATVVLIAAAAVAGYLPVRRALGVEPMVALRYE